MPTMFAMTRSSARRLKRYSPRAAQIALVDKTKYFQTDLWNECINQLRKCKERAVVRLPARFLQKRGYRVIASQGPQDANAV